MRCPLLAALVALVLAVLAGCGGSEQAAAPSAPAHADDPGVLHIHGLGRNPADGALMIATHTGLFRVAAGGGEAERVGSGHQDTMGFSVVGPDHFLGSGHPGKAGDPPFLGLIESRDAGQSWQPVSLRGEVDFHVLEAQDRTVYGFGSDFDTRSARFLRSRDGGRSWKRLTAPEPLSGLAIDPGDPRRIVAMGAERGHVSRDGGRRWRPLDVPGGLVTWTRELGLVAAGADGVVRTAADPAGAWTQAGTLPGPPVAFEGVGDELLAATQESVVLSSRDGGRTWTQLLGP